MNKKINLPLFIIVGACAHQDLMIKQSLQTAHDLCRQAQGLETRSPQVCQEDVAYLMSQAPLSAISGVYVIKEEILDESEQIKWMPGNRKWSGQRRFYNVDIVRPDTHTRLLQEPMGVDIIINSDDKRAVIDGVFVPEGLRSKGYGLMLVQWALYKIKQIDPNVQSVLLESSTDGTPDDMKQRVSLYLRAGFKPYYQPYLNDAHAIADKIIQTPNELIQYSKYGLVMKKDI